MDRFVLHFDGSCGPKNPGGTAAYGFSLAFGDTVVPGHGVIGQGPGMSNNLAEFVALHKGLEHFLTLNHKKVHLSVYGDSNLVISMMNKKFKPNREKLYYPGYVKAAESLRAARASGCTVSFDWVPREKNQICDDLSKAHQTA